MNCANGCGGTVRLTEDRDGIEKHDGRYEFEYVHEDGNPFCPIPCIAWPPPARTPSLSEHDRRMVGIARELAALKDDSFIMAYTGETDPELARSNLLGQAQFVLRELADLAERLGEP